jgi:anti-anti-sigma factor
MPETGPYLESAVERGVLVLTVIRQQIEGEDIAAALKAELADAVDRAGVNKVILDLRICRYVSSIAFWPLLALRKQLAESEGRLIICGLTGAVYEVFSSTRMVSSSGALDAPFEMAPDRDAALARLAYFDLATHLPAPSSSGDETSPHTLPPSGGETSPRTLPPSGGETSPRTPRPEPPA